MGGQGDLIVLEQNLFDIDPHGIHNMEVELTMLNGVIRHRDGLRGARGLLAESIGITEVRDA